MRRVDIQPGVALYYATGDAQTWRYVPPNKAVVVDPGPFSYDRSRAAYRPDPAGNWVLVELHEAAGVRQAWVHRRHLRGLWREMLEETGRTEEGVALYLDGIRRAAASPDPMEGLLQLAAEDPHLPDGALAILVQAADGGDVREVA